MPRVKNEMSILSFGPEWHEALVGPGDGDLKRPAAPSSPSGASRRRLYESHSAPAAPAAPAELPYAPTTPAGRSFARRGSVSTEVEDDDAYVSPRVALPAEKQLSTTSDSSARAGSTGFEIPSATVTLNGYECTFSMPEIGTIEITFEGHAISMSLVEMYDTLSEVLTFESSSVPVIFGAKGLSRAVFGVLFGWTPAQRRSSAIIIFVIVMIFLSSWLLKMNHEEWVKYNSYETVCDGTACWKKREIKTYTETNSTGTLKSGTYQVNIVKVPPPLIGDTPPENFIVSLIDLLKNYMVNHVSTQFDWLKRNISHHFQNTVVACFTSTATKDAAGHPINCTAEAANFSNIVVSAIKGILRIPIEGIFASLFKNITLAGISSVRFDYKEFLRQIGAEMGAMELIAALDQDVHADPQPLLQNRVPLLRAASPVRARATHPCGPNPTWIPVGNTGREYCVDSEGKKWNKAGEQVNGLGRKL